MNDRNDLAALRAGWKPPAGLSMNGPREVRLSGAGKALATFAGLFILGAFAAGYGLTRAQTRQNAEDAALRSTGVVTDAVVTRRWRTSGKGSANKIAYEFHYGGRTYRASMSAPRRVWATMEAGSHLAVRMVPGSPEINHPVAWDRSPIPPFLPELVSALLVACGLLMLWLIRRQTQLLAEGRAAPARVTRVRRVKNGHSIRYEFALPNGASMRGRGESRRPPEVGATIAILYDADRPKRNTPYPLQLARVDR